MNYRKNTKTIASQGVDKKNVKPPLWKRLWVKTFFFLLIIPVTRHLIIPYLHPTLHQAVQQSNLAKIKDLHKKGHSLDALDSNGLAPMHYAATNDSTEAIKLLLKLGANIDIKTRKKKTTPLMLAVLAEKISHVNILLQNNAKINLEPTPGGSALRLAVEKNNVNITELLLKHNAKVEAYASDGLNILHYAIQTNKLAMIKLLLKYNANIETPAKLNIDTPPIHLTACYGREEIARLLIKHGANPNQIIGNNKNKISPLHIAAENGNTVVQALLEYGANTECFTKEGLTPIHIAVANNNPKSVKLLIKHHANINVIAKDKLGHTPLCLAIQHGNSEMVSHLISLGADITIPLTNNMSPLSYATTRNNLKICEILIKSGADVNATPKNTIRLAPIHYAVAHASKEMLSLLISYGANIDQICPGVGTGTALAVAAAKGYIEKAALLLKHGADINKATTTDRVTVLHSAVGYQQKNMVAFLIKNGANVDIKTPKGKSILDTAKATKNKDIINLIEKHSSQSQQKRT